VGSLLSQNLQAVLIFFVRKFLLTRGILDSESDTKVFLPLLLIFSILRSVFVTEFLIIVIYGKCWFCVGGTIWCHCAPVSAFIFFMILYALYVHEQNHAQNDVRSS